jgi:hypothetical protein
MHPPFACPRDGDVVHKGRLLMKFRDRDEITEEGEFIVVRTASSIALSHA